jgi:hypothetical protein
LRTAKSRLRSARSRPSEARSLTCAQERITPATTPSCPPFSLRRRTKARLRRRQQRTAQSSFRSPRALHMRMLLWARAPPPLNRYLSWPRPRPGTLSRLPRLVRLRLRHRNRLVAIDAPSPAGQTPDGVEGQVRRMTLARIASRQPPSLQRPL